MPADNLIPLKLVLSQCGVSRVTFWRASSMDGFPAPVRKSGRLFWRPDQVEAIKTAIGAYGGRSAFDAQRKVASQRIETRYTEAAALKQSKRRKRRARAPETELPQIDLFES